jgi:hypothetical protein
VPPPADAPTRILTGFVGHSWACARPGNVSGNKAARTPAAISDIAARRLDSVVLVISSSPVRCCRHAMATSVSAQMLEHGWYNLH